MKKYNVSKTHIISDGKKINLYILKPLDPKPNAPSVLWIHGGGYITGMANMYLFSRAKDLVTKYKAVVVTPEYRLSKEAPYPAALKDCYQALRFIKLNAKTLGINQDQIMVGGESAGGGLCAAVCMLARDKKEINIAYQMPLYPMIDDRDTPSSKDNHAPVWNTRLNHIGWKAYLGKRYQTNEVSAYAAPARQTNYANLPPAYTFVGDIEPFFYETCQFIDNLKKAGVPAKVDIYSNCFHAFDMLLPFLPVSKKAIARFEEEFVYATKHYFAKQYK